MHFLHPHITVESHHTLLQLVILRIYLYVGDES